MVMQYMTYEGTEGDIYTSLDLGTTGNIDTATDTSTANYTLDNYTTLIGDSRFYPISSHRDPSVTVNSLDVVEGDLLIRDGDLKVDGNITCNGIVSCLKRDIDIKLRLKAFPDYRGSFLQFETRSEQPRKTLRSSYDISDVLANALGNPGELKRTLFEILENQARESGKALAEDMIKGDNVEKHKLRETRIQIPINGGKETFSVRLGDLITENLELDARTKGEGESRLEYDKNRKNEIVLDFKKVQLAVKNQKKVIYQQKLKTIMIFKKENKAKDLLKTLVDPRQFKNYKKNRFIDVVDVKDKWKVYRIWKDNHIDVIDLRKQKVIHELCTHLDFKYGCPKTDEVVAKLMMARFDVQALYNSSNKYDRQRALSNQGGLRNCVPAGITREVLVGV